MKKTKAVKKVKKSVAVKVKKQASIKKISKTSTLERERVLYSFDNKSKSITASFKTHSVNITASQVKELLARKNDLKRFYSYCNADVKLLSRLHADAQAKKQQECKNTQYDSRKKLLALLIQLSLSSMKQKAKVISKVKKHVSSK